MEKRDKIRDISENVDWPMFYGASGNVLQKQVELSNGTYNTHAQQWSFMAHTHNNQA